MVTDIDWVARLRTAPSVNCPEEGELRAFVERPEDVTPASFAHVINGCLSCRAKLQEIALHPSMEVLKEYVRRPEEVPEEVVFHCVGCDLCQARVREALGE